MEGWLWHERLEDNGEMEPQCKATRAKPSKPVEEPTRIVWELADKSTREWMADHSTGGGGGGVLPKGSKIGGRRQAASACRVTKAFNACKSKRGRGVAGNTSVGKAPATELGHSAVSRGLCAVGLTRLA